MQPQRHREDPAGMDFVFHHSNMMGISRRCGGVESCSFAVPLISAFHSIADQRDRQHQQLSCDTSYQKTHDQAGDSDDDRNSPGTDLGDRINDDTRRGSGGSERRNEDTVHRAAAGDLNGSTSQKQTSRKHDYTVAELLRNDRSSPSATYDFQTDSGPPDSHRHDEAGTSPSNNQDSAFHSWNVEQVDRPKAPLPPLFPLYTTHHHRWTDWMFSDSCRRTEFDNEAQQRRFFGLLDTPPVNFMSTYGHLRRGTERHLPLAAFGQEYPIPHRSLGEKGDHQYQHHHHHHQQQQQQQQQRQQRVQEHESAGRRQRTTFSAEQTLQLEVEYQRVEYVARPRRCELAKSLGLTDTQVKIWFQNRRAKDKRIEKAHVDRHIRSMQVMYSLKKDTGCQLNQVVSVRHSPPPIPLPTARSIHSSVLAEVGHGTVRRNWQTLQ